MLLYSILVLTSKGDEKMANLFKGYLKSIGKKCIEPIKGGKLRAVPPEAHDYVGVLREEYVQVDFDDEVSCRIALDIVKQYKLKCDILKTTRGCHLYFKADRFIQRQSVHLYNAIGLPSDIGLGCKDRVVPLRTTKDVETTKIINGEEVITTTKEITVREWMQTYDEVDVIPPIFRPIGKQDFDLKKSTSRNQELFNYILTLQTHGFTKDEVRYIIKTINKFILYEPLSDKEIDTITRDEAFSEELFFGEKGQFLHDKFGNYMLSNCNIIKIENVPHIYNNNNLYTSKAEDFERIMTDKIQNLKDNNRKEVYKYIQLRCDNEGEYANPKYVGLKDSILDIQTGEEFPYSPKWVINNRIKQSYNESAYSEVMDKTLNKVCGYDPQIRALLEEMIGYTMYRKNSMQVCFILTGAGSNGKSTILNCIKKLIGRENYCSLDLKELEETFTPAELHGKLANIGDDISAKYLESSSVFKKVVTGESFVVQKKYGQPFELECYATQIFCANELPQVKDKSDGFSRRIVIVPFMAKFSRTDVDYDPFIEDKLLADDSIQYLMKLAIDGLKRVIYNKQFTKSDKGETEKDEYLTANNNVLEWLEEEPHIENESVNDVYLKYCVWCTQSGCQAVKKLNFSKEIKKKYNFGTKVKSIMGKSTRIYCEVEEV